MWRTIRSFIVLAFLIPNSSFLISCGIYSRYSRPDLEVLADTVSAVMDTSRMDSSLKDSTAVRDSLFLIPHSSFFTDPCLQVLLDSALSRNTDLRTAYLSVEQAQAQLVAARLAYLPSLDFDAQGSLSRFNGSTTKTYDIGLAAEWDIDLFGKITNAKLQALAAYEGDIAYADAVKAHLVSSVAETYYTLLALDAQISISEQTLSLWDTTITMLQALVAAGQSNDVAVLQARADRNALDASILTLKQTRTETENSLCSLLRLPAHPILRGTLEDQAFPIELTTSVSLQALCTRPDVRQAEADLKEAFYAHNAARSAFYPQVTLSGTLGWTNGSSGIVNPGKWLSEAIASLTAPLFDRGTLHANLTTARAAQDQATLAFEQTLLDASFEVNNALIECQTARQRITLDQQQVDDLAEAVRKTDLLVRHSSANYLEVLTAQQSLLDAQLTLADDQAALCQGIAHLYAALTTPI